MFLPLNDMFILFKICSIRLALKIRRPGEVSNFIVYNAYSGHALSLQPN